jgi:hypothetical protein
MAGAGRGAGVPACQRSREEIDARAAALRALDGSPVSFLVAGVYALFEYTGIFRDTKDLDLFVRRSDLQAAFRVLETAGFRTEPTDPSWIGKAFRDPWYVDLIFSSGNGIAAVDDAWFEHARRGRVMDVEVQLPPRPRGFPSTTSPMRAAAEAPQRQEVSTHRDLIPPPEPVPEPALPDPRPVIRVP